MSIVVRELVVRAQVNCSPKQSPSKGGGTSAAPAAAAGTPAAPSAAETAMEKMMEALELKKER